MSNLVTVEINDYIADVRLNRPEKHNAQSFELMRAIIDTANELAQNKEIRAVVLSGNGKSFSAGIDTTAFTGGGESGAAATGLNGGFVDGLENFPNFFQQVGWSWRQIPVPVIAALHGVTFGAGCQLALGADIRIAEKSTRMSVLEIKWGLIPDMSGTQTLRDLVRLDVAKELTFTGRVVEADEALAIGLVTRLSDNAHADAMEMAKLIASKSPDAISSGKLLFNETWHGEENKGFEMEQELQRKLLMSKNQIEAIMSNMEKRDANYDNRSD